MNESYVEGTEVVSSFYVSNATSYAITPDMGLTVNFRAYYLDGTDEVNIAVDSKSNIVIPANEKNLVYFKWSIPEGFAGKRIYTVGYINRKSDNMVTLNETNYLDNASTHGNLITAKKVYADPGSAAKIGKPDDFQMKNPPSSSSGSLTWWQWEYKNGQFVKVTYGLQLDTKNVVVAPSDDVKNAKQVNGKWEMQSGYGIQIKSVPETITISGYSTPPIDSYTFPQSFIVRLPEYNFSTLSSKVVTASVVQGKLMFDRSKATASAIHFIPSWYPDGDYVINIAVSDIWTPAGKLSGVVSSNAISIKGSIYDDYYYGK